MVVYVVFFIVLIVGLLVNSKKSVNQFYLLFVVFFLWLLIGLRNGTVGSDTPDYINDFIAYSKKDFNSIMKYAFSRSEPLYVIITWMTSLITDSFTVNLLIWALFPTISLYRLFKEEFLNVEKLNINNGIVIGKHKIYGTAEVSMAIIVGLMIGLLAFYFNAVRQTAALSILLWGYHYFKRFELKDLFTFYRNKNILIFLFLMVIAYLIHNSSILVVLAFLLKGFRFRNIYILIAFAAYFFSQYFNTEQMAQLSSLLFMERFQSYGTYYESSISISGYIMQLILFIMCCVKKDSLIKEDKENNFFFNAMLLGLIIQSLAVNIAEMYRVAYYFNVFSLILVPKVLREYRKTTLWQMIYLFFILASIGYLFFLSDANLPVYSSVIF